jgi:hypothetical protein
MLNEVKHLICDMLANRSFVPCLPAGSGMTKYILWLSRRTCFGIPHAKLYNKMTSCPERS